MCEDADPREESIKVCCRFRPQNDQEKMHSGKSGVEVPADGVTVRIGELVFTFDRVFGVTSTQKMVYDYAAKPIINSVLKGFNGTVFAYGQTASGKTYTMEGDMENKVHQGVIPRMVWSIFDGIYHAEKHHEFLVKVSIVEIYNERIRDLLDPKKDNLKIHEDKERGIFIGEVTENYVGSEQDIFDVMLEGQINRSMAVTNMNEHSSRSHLVFTLTITQKNLLDRSVKVGKLHLVDLAGSEKVAKTGASGERLDEAKNINRSLSALGNVINALTDKQKTHVPYRDSKLTRVLQESLGGNSKTQLIITCSPSVFNEQETISTCRFGQRAKMIKNVVKVNLERSAEELKIMLARKDQLLTEARSRVSALETLLRSRGLAMPTPEPLTATFIAAGVKLEEATVGPGDLVALQRELLESRNKIKESGERLAELGRDRDELESQLRSIEEEKERLQSALVYETEERDQLEYERNLRADEEVGIKDEKQGLQQQLVTMTSLRQVALSDSLSDAGLQGTGRADERDADKQKDDDRPLKKKVSQLDKNLEQLTVCYHKLVAQNSGLKVEKTENDKKIQRKEARITQLERNLREAKQKYEKLLTQCANLTAAMDVMGRGRAAGFYGSGGVGGAGCRRSNIVRPVRGGFTFSRAEDGSHAQDTPHQPEPEPGIGRLRGNQGGDSVPAISSSPMSNSTPLSSSARIITWGAAISGERTNDEQQQRC